MADAPADLEIRLLRPGDDPDAQLDLSERAFGPGSGTDRDRRGRAPSPPVSPGRAPAALPRAGPGEAAVVSAVLGRVHEAAGDCGPVTWDADSAGDWVGDPGLYAYPAEDGVLAYRWQGGNEGLLVERAEAVSAQTVRALWTHI